MKRASHFIEIYQNGKGEVKTGSVWPIEKEPFHVLGNKVRGWKTLLILKFRMHENSIKRTESN